MLSRVANSLCWMARYLERADNLARLVDVNLKLLPDLVDLEADEINRHWVPIIESTGDEEAFNRLHPSVNGQAVMDFMVFQTENPNSIISTISAARENARMVRDQITAELWEEINRLYLFLRSPRAREIWHTSAFELLDRVRGASLLIQGLDAATVVHDEGWHFMQVGRFLERADKTTRFLDLRWRSFTADERVKDVGQVAALEWGAILRSCSAWDAYKTLHSSRVDPSLVAELLIFAPEFPRSVRFCAEQADRALRAISGSAAGRFAHDAERLSGKLVAELQFGTLDEVLLTGLHEYLDCLQIQFNDIGDALFQTYIFQPFNLPTDELWQQQQQQ